MPSSPGQRKYHQSDTHPDKGIQKGQKPQTEGQDLNWCHKVAISKQCTNWLSNNKNKKILHQMDNTNHHQDESKPRDLPPLEILPEHHKFEKMKSPETSTQVSDSNASSPNNNEDSLNKQQISPNLKTHKQTTRHTIRQTKKCIYYDIIKEWEKRNQSKIQSQSLASTLKNLNKTSDLAHICRTITYKD